MKAFPRNITVKTMKVRHIGIENELGVIDSWGSFGYGEISIVVRAILDKDGLLSSIGSDGGGREFRTSPISIKSLHQKRGYECLKRYYETLKPITRVLASGGTHLHISILEGDHPNMESNATAIAVAFFNQFSKIAGRNTHWAYKFGQRVLCDASSVTGIRDFLNQHRTSGRTYRWKGSMLAPTRHQTLEFRGPKGSNDPDEIFAWAEFLENVVNIANQDRINGVQFKDLLVGDRIGAYLTKLKGWRKLTAEQLNQKLNEKKLA